MESIAKETMLCLHISFVLFIEQPTYHCTLPLSLHWCSLQSEESYAQNQVNQGK